MWFFFLPFFWLHIHILFERMFGEQAAKYFKVFWKKYPEDIELKWTAAIMKLLGLAAKVQTSSSPAASLKQNLMWSRQNLP